MYSYKMKMVIMSLGFGAIASLSGCGKKLGNISVASDPFNTSGATANTLAPGGSSGAVTALAVTSPTTTVQEFKICVKTVKLENADGKVEQENDGEDEISFSPGLLDLSTGTAINWGNVVVPVGFSLQKVVIKARMDPASCQNAQYSVDFNGVTTTQDVQFNWTFQPPVQLNDGAGLKLALGTVVGNLRMAMDNGTLDTTSLKGDIESEDEAAHE